ncbi:9739_t:CDS:2, partial [Dentiscutata heterogama]
GRRKPCYYNQRDSVKCMSKSITVAKKKIQKRKEYRIIIYKPDCATDLFAKTIPLLAKK